MEEKREAEIRIRMLAVLLAAAFFLIDISIPLGVAGGVPYVAVVLLSLRARERRFVLYAALGCSLLTIAGYFISPHGGELWKVVSNRFLALLAIWVTAALGMGLKGAQAELQKSRDELEERVLKRTRALREEIAERKRAEAQIIKLSSAVEQSHATIMITDSSGIVEYVNPKFTEVTGYASEEVLGRNPSILKSGHTSSEEYERLWKTILSGEVWTGEFLNRKKDGEFYWELASISPVRDRRGEITSFIAVGEDITERKLAEAALRKAYDELESRVEERTKDLSEEIADRKRIEDDLRESEAKYRSLVETLPDSVVVHCDGRIVYANAAAAEMFAAPDAQSLLGLKIMDFVSSESKDVVLQRMKQVLDKGGSLPLIYEKLLRLDATVLDAEVAAIRTYHEGRPAIQVIIRDITERRRAELRIETALAEKEVLLKEIHHRVKNNLQVVSSILSLQAGYIENPDLRSIFQESQDRIRSMGMIHEMLYQSDDLGSIDFAGYVRRLVATLFKNYAPGPSHIDLKLEVPDCPVDIDTSIQLGLVLNELCSNALKHAFPNGRSGELRIEFRPLSGGMCSLTVSDNGVGLPEGFDIRELDSMGLQLIDSMTAQLGGVLEVEGAHGASFSITFPYPKRREKERAYDHA